MASIRINRVYTRSGDDGETGLVGGQRLSKADLRIEAIGEVDELNAALAVLKESLKAPLACLRPLIEHLQQELFDIGAELACLPSDATIELARTTAAQVRRLEDWCDHFNSGLPELSSFIVPGGSPEAAAMHMARCICRRAERRCIALQHLSDSENKEVLKYLNRLSDLLFIWSRWALEQQAVAPGEWLTPEKRTIPKLP